MVGLLCAAVAIGAPVAREVSFSGYQGLVLKGTLRMPLGAKSAPAVLLLPGSGPIDRDGNAPQLGVKTDVLKQIADGLAAKGIGSLRFDKRATSGYAKLWPRTSGELDQFFSFEAFAGDAEAALNYLRKQPGVSAKRTGIVGHSEGGLIALYLGQALSGTPRRVPALGLLATAGRTMDDVILDQLRSKLPKQLPQVEVAKYLDYATKALEASKSGVPFPPNPPMGLAALFNPTIQSLMHAYVTIDPGQLAATYDGSAIVFNGEYDNQVSAEKDAGRLFEKLQGRKRGTSEKVVVPKAGHNFKATNSPDENQLSGPIVSPVLDELVTFLRANL